ncbi:hypothetical protein D3C72_2249130 [compost metagenome]
MLSLYFDACTDQEGLYPLPDHDDKSLLPYNFCHNKPYSNQSAPIETEAPCCTSPFVAITNFSILSFTKGRGISGWK